MSLKPLLLLAASVLLACPPMSPQAAQTPAAQAPQAETHAKGDISGDWQGTLQAGKALRLVIRIAKTDKVFAGKFYSLDQPVPPLTIPVITLDGSTVKFALEIAGATYQGTLGPDGNTMTGNWVQGSNPLPLTLVRATKETAWEIPAPPPPIKTMAPDADPTFDVATIKPNNSGATSMQGLNINGRNFTTRNSSLGDLLSFAYEVHSKQIVNGPDWMDKDRYDINAVPDIEGAPSVAQIRVMIRKLLADRFKLTFHKEERDLSAYVLTAPKPTDKLKLTELKGPLPGIGFRPGPGGITLGVRNGTLSDFTGFLQLLVLDRPVVNRTGLTEKYDFNVLFTPDDSQFNGHPPPLPAKTDNTESAPGLFDALQQQLGLKLEVQKTNVQVIAIDHVEKPNAN